MPDPKNNDEIDLMEFLLKTINIVKANFWLIVIFFILGSTLGIGYFYSAKKVFESKMIINSDILTESYGKVLFDNLNRHRKERNLAALHTLLNIPESKVSAFSSIGVEKLDETEVTESNRFLITAMVFDWEILPSLQAGIVNFLEKNEYVKVRVEQNKDALKKSILETDRELQDLRDFKARIFNGDFFERARGNVMFDPTIVNSKILEFTEKKIKLENELQLSNSVEVIVGFTTFNRHTSPKLSLSLVAGAGVGLCFVFLLIAFKSVRKLMSMADATK
jgi:hypothetical protein